MILVIPKSVPCILQAFTIFYYFLDLKYLQYESTFWYVNSLFIPKDFQISQNYRHSNWNSSNIKILYWPQAFQYFTRFSTIYTFDSHPVYWQIDKNYNRKMQKKYHHALFFISFFELWALFFIITWHSWDRVWW